MHQSSVTAASTVYVQVKQIARDLGLKGDKGDLIEQIMKARKQHKQYVLSSAFLPV